MNEVQRLQLERVRLGSFNGFDGEQVTSDLADHEDLWKGFVFGRFGYFELIELRDIEDGHLNADTLMILTTEDKWQQLQMLIKSWNADEVGFIQQKNDKLFTDGVFSANAEKDFFTQFGSALGNGRMVVRVWWD